MCVGKTACLPAILVSIRGVCKPPSQMPRPAWSPSSCSGAVTDFPATARYGGGVQLVKSILTTMDVWTPEPGQVPSGG